MPPTLQRLYLPIKPPRDATRRRIAILMAFCLGFAAILVARAALIQLFPNVRLETMARRQFQSKVLILPRRGSILDRNGEPLAINAETQSLAVNPMKIQNRQSRKTLARLLSKAIDLPYAKLFQKMGEKREFAWVKRHLSDNELNQLKKWRILGPDGDLPPGLWMIKESQRKYPHAGLASHVLGDVNVDSEGLEGTELWMNDRLRGNVVSVNAIKDALGRPTFIDSSAAKKFQDAKDGESITLTLDASLQYAVEQELKTAVQKTGSRAGSVMVMNSVTGEILTMANEPSFDPNDPKTAADRRRNRTLTDGYEPGSTMKPILLATALTHGWKLSSLIWGERGEFQVQGKRITEAEAHEQFEWLNLKEVIKVSSNVGAAKLALKVGADHYFNVLKGFGFGKRSGIGFPGEISGKIPPRRSWQPLSLANIGFGQGILVTPIQMVRAYAAFLNGGWLVQPILMKSPKPETLEPPRRILSARISEQVLEALESATQEGGTGTKAVLTGYRIAGKTGTAQKVDPNASGYSKSKYVASFIGFALEVEPKLVIYAALDEPRGVYYASETAAPLFREVLSAVANRFGLPTLPAQEGARILAFQDTLKTSQSVASRRPAEEPIAELRWSGLTSTGRLTWKMPSLRGLTPREAIRVLKGHDFRMEILGSGIIHSQTPEPGKTLAEGDLVRLSLLDP